MRTYIAIDLKSFYASVECVDRCLDPLATHLVVADPTRTDKTICLAVSPSLKACGIPGRPRLFEVIRSVRSLNASRLRQAPGHRFTGSSVHSPALLSNPSLALDYIVAPPRMARYLEVSARIYSIYLQYLAPEEIHVYSIDEVFIDATGYIRLHRLTPHEFAMILIRHVLKETGITATAGIGTNLYLSKVAMDIVAKHLPADTDGVRIAEIDEMSYRRLLWGHRPLTDFWRIGHGIASRLESNGIFTMGDIALASVTNEERLYRMFGVNAELIIDHAWGWEPCTLADIKRYRPMNRSLSTGQVLAEPCSFARSRLILKEMSDSLTLDLVEKSVVTDQLVLAVGYETLRREQLPHFHGQLQIDAYGRLQPASAHGSLNLDEFTSSSRKIILAATALFDRIVNPSFPIRRLCIAANHILPELEAANQRKPVQLELFVDYEALERQKAAEDAALDKEKRAQRTILDIRRKLGKNAILKGMNLEEGATACERNQQIGGHHI